MPNKAVITAVTNQKGGTGKTTTCENLGVGLAMAGKKVLLVDTDPQASLTVALGYPRPDDLPVTLSDLMGKIIQDRPIAPGEGILHHPEGVDLVPANIALAGTEVSLVNAMSRETVLKQYLETVKKDYDFILLDCMPSLGMLTVNALAASDQALIPVQANYLSAKGLDNLESLLTYLILDIYSERVALGSCDSCKADTCISRGGLNDHGALFQKSLFLSVLEHGLGNSVLDTSCRIQVFQFHQNSCFQPQFLFNIDNLHQRCISDQFNDSLINV